MFGPILWPLMNISTTKHYNLDNFRARGSTSLDFGASGNWKWPMESLSLHELMRVKGDRSEFVCRVICDYRQFFTNKILS